jgi:hypothetical protein
MVMAWAVVALVAIMPAMKVGGTFTPDHRLAELGHPAVTSGFPAKVEPDPTDNGSIIIECVALGDRLITGESGSAPGSQWRPAGVPRYPLGPSNCWPQEES